MVADLGQDYDGPHVKRAITGWSDRPGRIEVKGSGQGTAPSAELENRAERAVTTPRANAISGKDFGLSPDSSLQEQSPGPESFFSKKGYRILPSIPPQSFLPAVSTPT